MGDGTVGLRWKPCVYVIPISGGSADLAWPQTDGRILTLPPFGKDSGRRCLHRLGNGFGTATRTSPPRCMRGQCQDAPQTERNDSPALAEGSDPAKKEKQTLPEGEDLDVELGYLAEVLVRVGRG
jgi:hypothetical protein